MEFQDSFFDLSSSEEESESEKVGRKAKVIYNAKRCEQNVGMMQSLDSVFQLSLAYASNCVPI